MDPLNIHHVIRHPLSRIETNNFQDKSGCSINGIRSFLFDEGIVRNLDDLGDLIGNPFTIQDYRGYPIKLLVKNFDNYPLSDEILRMKNIIFEFGNESKPNHKLVSPEPHFVEEERNLIENHFNYLGDSYDIEDWDCFDMDYEGHLVSIISPIFQLSNKSIEHLSNFPYLRNLNVNVITEESVTNFSLLSNLKSLKKVSMGIGRRLEDPELFKDLGLFSNLLSLDLISYHGF